jgi:hypothetical protein
MRTAVPVIIKNDDDRSKLLRWSRGRSTPHRLVLRSKIVLLASEGSQNKQIAAEQANSRRTSCSRRHRNEMEEPFRRARDDGNSQGRASSWKETKALTEDD